MADELAAISTSSSADVSSVMARTKAVEKTYGDVCAVRPATVDFHAGRIHTVCGENGAGKSTLLKIVAGMVVPDSGSVEIFGAPLHPHSPREAIRRGVGMVLQHFALVPVFTALENIVLGAEPTNSFGVIDMAAARRDVEKVERDLGLRLPLDAAVETLGVGDRQRLEIARALYRDARLLILDEPTAVLTKGEATALYATLRRLADGGKGIVVVTHKMDEVRDHADVVTVLRRGELVSTTVIARGEGDDLDAQIDVVTKAIMGAGGARGAGRAGRGDAGSAPERVAADALPSATGEVLVEMTDVRVGRALRGVSLVVRAGEIVGIAGVEGNGQREIVGVLAGEITPDAGRRAGGDVAVIREDRQSEGLVLDASLRDNIVLGELGRFAGVGGVLDLDALEHEAKSRVERSGAPPDLDRAARTLSGGNQQKVVVARALSRLASGSASGSEGARARVLVAAQPTRGVDLGASADIHARLREAAARGAGVLVLSADLGELRVLCSRILVLARGKIVAEVSPAASDEEIGTRMLSVATVADEATRSQREAKPGAAP